MTTRLSWVGPVLLATTLFAQQGPPDPKPSGAAASPAAERLAALEAEAKQLMDDYSTKARAAAAKAKEAREAGQPVPALPMRPDLAPLTKKALAAAAEFAGTDDAAPLLMFVVQNGGPKNPDVVTALDTLTDKHLDHPALVQFGPMIVHLARLVPEADAARLRDRLAKSANADVRGWTLFAMHQQTIEKGDRDGDAYRTARLELTKAADGASPQLARSIREAIDLREKFGAGNVAPDIVGTDLDGVEFKLSDYRGKVVFLDFWGDW